MNSILFLGCFYPSEIKDRLLKYSKRGFQFAADNLQWALINGIIDNKEDLTLLTIPSLSSFPFGYKRIIVPNTSFKYRNCQGNSIGYVNIPFMQKTRNRILSSIDKWMKISADKKVIIVYSLQGMWMDIIFSVKKKYNDIKVIAIVPDLPEFMGCNKYYKLLGLDKKNRNKIYDNLYLYDGFVVLAEAMREKLNISSQNSIVIEGIYGNEKVLDNRWDNKKIKYIFYGGELSQKYGVLTLIKAFHKIDNRNYKLVLCGDGDCVSVLQQIMSIDDRILYLGTISREKVLEWEVNSFLLVNPRTADGEYTKYSFPSKTMEYLASGTPTLLNQLPGIPQEYYQYCFTIQNNNIEALSHQICEILEMDLSYLQTLGFKAQKFILENKTPLHQCEKLINFINYL